MMGKIIFLSAKSLRLLVLLGVCAPHIMFSQVVINEYSVSNLSSFMDNYQKYEDWIELYNAGGAMVLLSGYYLSDDPGNPQKWEIPAGISIAPGGFVRFWASGRDEVLANHYHTNFRLTQSKATPESVVFTDPAGTILEQHQLQITQLGHSRGRKPDGSSTWMIFTNPSCGTSNNNATASSSYAAPPVMSHNAGFYVSSFLVSLYTPEPNAQIRYTIDGTEPTSTSTLYSQAIPINATQVLKAKTFSQTPGILPSLPAFHTYFINVDHNLPVISVSGNQLQTLLNGNQGLEPKGSYEYFDSNGARTTLTYGEFNKHGQDSWVNPQRSIDYVSRDECGMGHSLKKKFFNTSDREEFQRVIMRAAGDDNYPGIDSSAHLRDVFIQNLAAEANMNLDMRRGTRCVMYANGQYWGIYSIREKVDDHDYTDFYYDQGKYDIQFVKTWGSTWAEYGGQQAINDWNALKNYILNNNMTIQSNYDYVTSQYDIKSLVDYIIINSFVVCSDWLNWNVGIWRGFNPNGTHQKWGYILWDEDATFGHYINYTGVPSQSPYVSPCFPEQLTNNWQDPEYHIRILNKLRANVEFDQYYISRYIDLVNSSFSLSNVLSKLDSSAAIISTEMPQHVARWGGSMTQWLNNVQKVRNFLITRSSVLSAGLMNCYSLTGPYPLVVNAGPPGFGQVKVNSLLLDHYPWQGNYYGGVALRLMAIPASPNHELDHWTTKHHSIWPNDSAPEIIINLTMGDTVVAHFRLKNLMDSVVINEINYNSSGSFDPEDWVELYNPMPYALDVSQWVFKDEDDSHIFTFPQGTIINPYAYLVICRDTVDFSSLFPSVSPRIGNTGFGLSSGGELIRVYNSQGILIDAVTYGSQPPWPTAPNGTGATLELMSPTLDNALPQHWVASAISGGTPGAINTLPAANPEVVTDEKITIHIHPNPMGQYTTFTFISKHSLEGASLSIWNLLGQEVIKMGLDDTGTLTINREGLTSGIYICQLNDKNGNHHGSVKLMVP